MLRLRTRDQGPTELNPERSCQYYYDRWLPFIIMNVDEIIRCVQKSAPGAEIRIRRNHMVLGGKHGRFVPKDCYLKETGTAETAITVLLHSAYPGRVTIEDAVEEATRYTMRYRLSRLTARLLGSGEL